MGESRMTVSDVRSNFSEILGRIRYGRERIILTKSGRDVAAVISIEDLRTLENFVQVPNILGKKKPKQP